MVSNNTGKIAASNVSPSQLQSVITGGATTIIDYNLTPNKVVVSNADGKIGTSSVSHIEVGYLAGTTDLIQTQLNSRASQSTTYTKTEVNNTLALKANQATTYSKTEVDTNVLSEATQATTYSKTEVDNSLLLKANQSTTYSKLKLIKA